LKALHAAIRLTLCTLCVIALWLPGVAMAEFAVDAVDAKVVNERLTISFDLDLTLSDETEEAVNRGIPIIISVLLKFERDRNVLWNDRIVTWRRDVELRYHALSERYLVQETGLGDISSFINITDAMKSIAQGRTITIPVPELPTNADIPYQVRLKVKLDAESLPTPLRLVAYLSPAWRHSSRWTKWPVQH